MSKKKTNCLKLSAFPPVADCGNKFLFSCIAGFCSVFSDSLDFLVLLYQDKRTRKEPLRLLQWNITKTAGTDTAAAFTDTVTYTITVCNNSVNTQTGILSDITPTGFVTTSTTLPPTITLNSMECDTFTVSGYFTSPGSCFYNVASVTSPMGTTWKDSVCVTVINVCNVPNAQQIADSSFSLPMSASYSNVSFVLHGRFYVNDTLILTNCSVYAYPAAQIIVLTGGALILQGTSITACTQMWKGIMLNDKSRLVMTEQSLVADADIGIQAMNGSSFFLLGSSVTDCVRSIFVPQQSNGLNNVQGYVNDCRFGLYATAFKPDYTGQPPHHAMPRAGMEFNDVVMTIGDYQYNEFRNCNWGIYAVRSMLKVQKGRFYNMNKGGSIYGSAAHKGSAIVAESKTAAKAGKLQVADCQIDTCEHGIYTEWTTADINNVNALHVTGNGSYHLYCNSANMSTYVGACNIEAGKAGIVFQNSEQATMTAKNNTIKVTTGGSSTGIKIIATNSNAGNYVLKGNVIEAANGNGITVNFAKNATIVDNMIKLSGNTINGISLTGCDSSTVSCNNVIGRYPAVSYQNRGIYGSMNQKCYISCNTTDSLYKGVHFSSSNIATKFRGNEMKKHYIGLYLDNTAVIDTQTHAGNMWTGTYNSTYGAWNENDSSFTSLRQSLFIVDPTLGSVYNPNIPLGINPGEPNDQGWFEPGVGMKFECIGLLQCEDINPIDHKGSGDLKEAIATDEVLTTDYIEESKIIAKIFLYEEVKKDSAEYSSNSVLMQFINDNTSGPLGKLSNTKQYMKEAFSIASLTELLLKEKDSLLNIHLNNVLSLDSLVAADSSITNILIRETEIDEIDILKQEVNNIIELSKDTQKLYLAKAVNESIQSNEIPEYNLKQVNSINLLYQKTNSKDSISGYYAALLSIAEQCPQSGGIAVYNARSLVAFFNNTIFYDDDNVCLQQGYYRLSNELKNNKILKESALIPNPASKYADVVLNKTFEGICRIKITDIYSKMIFEKSFDCSKNYYRINTSGFLNGMYYVQIIINDNAQNVVKLIIVK